jgi:hypothetical protein
MPVAPAARVCPDSHSMCRHRGGVSSPPRTRHHASCIGLPSCSGASSRGACLPTAWTLRARARTRSKLLNRVSCSVSRRSLPKECRQRLAVQLKSLENLGRTSHNERLAMYIQGRSAYVRVHLDLHVSRSVHTLLLICSAALCVFGVLSSALSSSVRERSQRREMGAHGPSAHAFIGLRTCE